MATTILSDISAIEGECLKIKKLTIIFSFLLINRPIIIYLMEFLINFDDSLLDEGVIYNFIDRLIKDLIKCTTP